MPHLDVGRWSVEPPHAGHARQPVKHRDQGHGRSGRKDQRGAPRLTTAVHHDAGGKQDARVGRPPHGLSPRRSRVHGDAGPGWSGFSCRVEGASPDVGADGCDEVERSRWNRHRLQGRPSCECNAQPGSRLDLGLGLGALRAVRADDAQRREDEERPDMHAADRHDSEDHGGGKRYLGGALPRPSGRWA